jgi:hypothetical protein
MHGAFGTVILVVCIAAVVVGLLAVIANRNTWEEYGKDSLLMDAEAGRPPAAGPAGSLSERDEEIRQMLQARNARRLRRGEQPVDVEQELSRLTAPKLDPELVAEIRQLVKARNYRRTRAGKPPLDVDAEVEREISRLGDLR